MFVGLVVTLLGTLVGAQYDYMSDMSWAGPARGCGGTPGAGQAVVSCTLDKGNVTINVNRAASWLKITCEEKSSFSCSELEESRSHIADYISVNGQTDRYIDYLDVDSCIIPNESLKCLSGLVNASSVGLLRLIQCKGQLLDENVEGLEGVVKFRMHGVDKNTSSVPYSVLSKLPSLRSFTMKGGSLTLKPNNITLPHLRTLELAEGGLKGVPNEAFISTPNIQTLMLWGNKIDTVEEDAFKGLPNLANISLNSNNISLLPPTVFSHSPLARRIDLYNNRLTTLQSQLFQGLEHLEEVIILSNRANLSLEDAFRNLPSLKNLKLETSFIELLPASLLGNSTSLVTVSLQGNRLEHLPPHLFAYQRLVELNLKDNRIAKLPAMLLSKQTELVKLDLRRNFLKDLPGGLFSNAKSLKVLDISDNQIEMLDRYSFSGAENLVELYLAGNRIHYIKSATFDLVLSLQILSLARNNLTISETRNSIRLVSPDEYYTSSEEPTFEYYSMFKGLKGLRILNLSRNNVSIMCEDWRQLVYLEKLDLSYNSIDYLSDTAMHFDMTAVTVDVRNNKIASFVPATYPQPHQEVPRFLMGGNPFDCDCRLYEFVQRYATGKRITDLGMEDARCAAPPALRGTPLPSLAPDALHCGVPCGNCSCRVTPASGRLELDCPELPPNLPRLPEAFGGMRLSNQIHLRKKTDHIPHYYKYVDMSDLNLTEAPTVSGAVEVNLGSNSIERAPLGLFEANCTVHLSNNPLLCGCDDYGNVEILQRYRHLIRDYNETRCSDGASVSSVNINQLCVTRDSAVVGTAIAIFGLFLAVFTAIAYKYPTEIRILLRKYRLWWGDAFDDDKEYDAFVSYAHQDEGFVVEELVKRLEGGSRPLKLCVHYRNWVIGDFIPAQIARSVDRSRGTIIVLSRHFIDSVWGHMEFRTAHGRGRVIILMLDELTQEEERKLDPELKAYIAMNTYVKAQDPLVYDRIRDAVLMKSDITKPTGGLNVQLQDGILVNLANGDAKIDIPKL